MESIIRNERQELITSPRKIGKSEVMKIVDSPEAKAAMLSAAKKPRGKKGRFSKT